MTVNESIHFNAKTRVKVSARGIVYEIFLDDLAKHPTSRLGRLRHFIVNNQPEYRFEELCDGHEVNSRGQHLFYFNRDPYILNSILNCYSSDNGRRKNYFNDLKKIITLTIVKARCMQSETPAAVCSSFAMSSNIGS